MTTNRLSQSRIKTLRSLAQKKGREREQRFLVEGLRLCDEALNRSALAVESLIVTPERMTDPRYRGLLEQTADRCVELYTVPVSTFRRFSQTDTPQGIAAVVRFPSHHLSEWLDKPSLMILGLDRLQDPGNVGTILRTAEWFGVDAVLFGTGTVDAYNPKVIRSAMGALFRIPVFENIEFDSFVTMAKHHNIRVVSTQIHGGCSPYSYSRPARTLLLIGSEAHGLSLNVMSSVEDRLTIPRIGRGESLNAAVATAISLYELMR
jgi:TrmH family RNA methyltransferase